MKEKIKHRKKYLKLARKKSAFYKQRLNLKKSLIRNKALEYLNEAELEAISHLAYWKPYM